MAKKDHIPRTPRVEYYVLSQSHLAKLKNLVSDIKLNGHGSWKRLNGVLELLISSGTIRTSNPAIRFNSANNVKTFINWSNVRLEPLGFMVTRYFVAGTRDTFFVRLDRIAGNKGVTRNEK